MLDTNVLVSAVIAARPPQRLLSAALAGEFELCTSEVLLAELLDVLSRAKFAARLELAGLTPQGFVDDLRRQSVVVSPRKTPRIVLQDLDDDHVLAAAITGRADLIVSGDKRNLLPLSSYQGIPIVDARQAVDRLY